MPSINIPTVPLSPSTLASTSKKNLYNPYETKTDKFADFEIVTKFPKQVITSKMIKLSNSDSFLVSCLKSNNPIAIAQTDGSIKTPTFVKNNSLVPLKPLQKLHSLTERDSLLALSHGDHGLEFGKLSIFDNNTPVITRWCQKHIDQPYKKLVFKCKDQVIGNNSQNLEMFDTQKFYKLGSINSKKDILDFDFCPLEPSIIAFTNGNLNVVDTRQFINTPHSLYRQTIKGGILRWNPHVPYWIGTASPTSLDVFDIRYNGPMPMITINHSNIQDLCWSSTNCDLILASSKDRRINLWSLGYDSNHCRLNMTVNNYEISNLVTSESQSHCYYGLDENDSIIKMSVKREYLSTIAPHQSFEREYQDVEEALYSADMATFQSKLTKVSQSAIDSASYKKLKQLILLTMQPPRPTLEPRSIASIQMRDGREDFKNSLLQCTKLNYRNILAATESSHEMQEFVDQLRLKVRIVELLAAEDYDSIKKFMPLIIDAYCDDLNFLDIPHSIKFMALMLKLDRINGLRFFQSVSSKHSFGIPETLKTWMWMSLYPTIFDPRSYELLRVSASDNDSNCSGMCFGADDSDVIDRMRQQLFTSLLKDPKIGPQTSKIIQQVNFNIGTNPVTFQALLTDQIRFQDSQGKNEVIQEAKAMIFERNGNSGSSSDICIISAALIKCLLEESFCGTSTSLSFSSLSILSDFFHMAFRLQVLTCKASMETGIIECLKCVGYPRLKDCIKQTILNENKTHDSMNIVNTLNCVLGIVTDPYSTLSSDQLEYLFEKLSEISAYLETDGKNFNSTELKRLLMEGSTKLRNNPKFLMFKSKLMKLM